MLTEYKVFHDAEWKQFLQSLSNQRDKDVAVMTMNWIKDAYGQLVNEHWAIITKLRILQEEFVEALSGKLMASTEEK